MSLQLDQQKWEFPCLRHWTKIKLLVAVRDQLVIVPLQPYVCQEGQQSGGLALLDLTSVGHVCLIITLYHRKIQYFHFSISVCIHMIIYLFQEIKNRNAYLLSPPLLDYKMTVWRVGALNLFSCYMLFAHHTWKNKFNIQFYKLRNWECAHDLFFSVFINQKGY